MLIKLLKWGFIVVSFIALALWLGLSQSIIAVKFSNYTIKTDIVHLILLILIIVLPYRILRNVFKKISKKIHTLSYVRNLIRLTNVLEDNVLTQSVIKEIMQTNASNKDLKTMVVFIKTLKNSGSINAKFFVLQSKINKSLLFIYYKFLTLAFLKNNDYENFKFFAQRGLSLNHSGWFAHQLVMFYIKENNINDILHYKKAFKSYKFNSKELEMQTYCLINYGLANNYYNQSNYKDCSSICYDIIHLYPNFLPAYKLLLNVNLINHQSNKELLKKLWLNNPSYYAITLWVEFIEKSSYKTLLSELDQMFKHKDDEINKFLVIALSIEMGKYLEANEILSNIKGNNKLKDILAIKLAKKEQNIMGIEKNLQYITTQLMSKDYWWLETINL